MRIYTDASTNKFSGIAFVVTDEKHVEIYQEHRTSNITDNNTAELAAVCFALETVKHVKDTQINLFTDSHHVIHCIKKRMCKKEDERILLERIFIATKDKTLNVMWIKGHSEKESYPHHYNRMVDSLARKARRFRECKLIVNYTDLMNNRKGRERE